MPLVNLAAAGVSIRVVRLGNPKRDRDYLGSFSFDDQSYDEAFADFVENATTENELAEFLEYPFERKPNGKFGKVTRFSNGDWPVFYSAADEQTIVAEIKHWFAKDIANGEASPTRRRYYRRVAINCAGDAIDVRPNLGTWPDLISDDYAFCHRIGAEIAGGPVSALLAPSARLDGGTTIPVFKRRALNDPELTGTVVFTPSSRDGQVDIVTSTTRA